MTRSNTLRIAIGALLAALPVPRLAADGFIVVPHPVDVPHGHYRFAPLEVKDHRVTVDIDDQVATTEIDQSFYNPNPQQLEGHYLFPIPKGAQIDRFEMDVNGKMTAAELLDADKARKIYEDIVRKMRDPALLEYAEQGLFRARIFPIEPKSTKRIRLKYTEILRADAGLVGYRYPLNTEKFSAQPIPIVSIKVTLDLNKPIKSLYSPSHTVEITRKDERHAVVGFEANDTKPDTDFQLFYSVEPDQGIGLSLLTHHDGEGDGTFLLLASPGIDTRPEAVIPKDVVLVIDTSGSMAGEKLEQARRALRFCLENLNAQDRFELVRFSTEAEPLFQKLVEANSDNRARARTFVDSFRPIGGTAIEDALLAAVKSLEAQAEKGRPTMVIFLTDGRPTIGNTAEDQILTALQKAIGDKRVRVFCFGIGTDINTRLLDSITEKTRAASQYVIPSEDIEVKVSSFYTKIDSPVLTDVEFETSGDVRLKQVYPTPLPDLFKGEQLVLLGRYTGTGDCTITLSGMVNTERTRILFEGSFARAGEAREHDFIPRLWAVRRVGYLLDQIRLHGDEKELREEVTTLARRYGIVTPYTAYLIVEDETRREIPVASRAFNLGVEYGGRGAGRAEERLRESYDMLGTASTGGEAVAGARIADSLKSAATPGAPEGAMHVLSRDGDLGFAAGLSPRLAISGAAPTDEAAPTVARTRFVAGRTFFRNGPTWVDARVAESPAARRASIRFLSDEYFDLIARYPQARPWLALGANLQVEIEGTIYEISE